MLAVLLLLPTACARKDPNPRPLSPREALRSFHFSEDFRIELFAAEPQVVDPVEMAFDEDGRVYVAEMIDYPEDPPPGKPARSRIRLLEDTDGDGKFDRVTIFADQLLQVSGLLPWKGGLLVTSAPDILFMKDTDGDGKADVKQVLYTGFPKVNPEGRITNLRLGIDNWIYAANNGGDSRITSPDHPERPPVLVRGADFRFRPDRGLAEPASGPAQFGLTFDDWGNCFITQNTIHLRHVVVPMQYLTRAPRLAAGAVAQDISDHGRPSAAMFPLTAPQAWRVERTRLRQQRYDEQRLNRVEHMAGYFTAASGGTVYNGDVFPQEYRGNVFTGDVSGNLVHRDILTPDGVTFSAHRAKEGVEFLTSTDMWCRPCNFANAPDGNLYMMDIYRLFIETPESIPEELRKKMDFRAGDTMGRIYRITPNKPLRTRDLRPKLSASTTAELVRLLESTNGWHRQTAQRLLLHRQDVSAVPLLKTLVETSAYPQARIHGLWMLEGLSALDPSLIVRSLNDPDPHVREHALRLSEDFLSSPPVPRAVLARVDDPSPRVQFQLAFSLGQWRDARALDALAQVASTRATDAWFRTAILSSVSDSAFQFFQRLNAKNPAGENAELLSALAALIGAKHSPDEVARFLMALARRTQPGPGLTGLARGLKLSGVKGLRVPGGEAVLTRFVSHSSDSVMRAAWELVRYIEWPQLLRRASADARSSHLPPARRVPAVQALRGGTYAVAGPILRKILDGQEPPELQAAAVDTLSAFDDPAIAGDLLSRWKTSTPDLRRKVIETLLSRGEWMRALIQALEDKSLELPAVDAAARARLIDHSDSQLAQRARRLFQSQGGDRMQVVNRYSDVVKMAGDTGRGRKIFEQNCGACHLPRRQGGRVGPDLSGINNKSKEELLTSILNPSYAIEPRFVNYIVTTRDGRLYAGVLANETPGAITLRGGSDDSDVLVLRSNLAEIRASTISLMPDGFEESLSRQDLADIIAYLRGGL